MASMKRPRLSAVKALPDYRLELAFTNGEVRVVDKREAVFSKPGLVPLRDPAVFAQARVVPGKAGRSNGPIATFKSALIPCG